MRNEGLACSRRPHKYQIVILFKPPESTQFTQSRCGYSLRVVVIEQFQVMPCRQGCRFQAPLEITLESAFASLPPFGSLTELIL